MDLLTKTKLYNRVEASAGKCNIDLKAVEEFNELIHELSSVVHKILKDQKLTNDDRYALLDEMQDATIMIEQLFGIDDVNSVIANGMNVKLERLERYYLEGNLLSKFMQKLKRFFA